ncbi:MAG TPA: hypothetical protein VK111_00285, partial [Virgibacillus sp.]|nr:hypothetical protein [Virgibacillus sp.]
LPVFLNDDDILLSTMQPIGGLSSVHLLTLVAFYYILTKYVPENERIETHVMKRLHIGVSNYL